MPPRMTFSVACFSIFLWCVNSEPLSAEENLDLDNADHISPKPLRVVRAARVKCKLSYSASLRYISHCKCLRFSLYKVKEKKINERSNVILNYLSKTYIS